MYFGRWFHFYMDINNHRFYVGIIAKCCKVSAHCEANKRCRKIGEAAKKVERMK